MKDERGAGKRPRLRGRSHGRYGVAKARTPRGLSSLVFHLSSF